MPVKNEKQLMSENGLSASQFKAIAQKAGIKEAGEYTEAEQARLFGGTNAQPSSPLSGLTQEQALANVSAGLNPIVNRVLSQQTALLAQRDQFVEETVNETIEELNATPALFAYRLQERLAAGNGQSGSSAVLEEASLIFATTRPVRRSLNRTMVAGILTVAK